MIRLLRNRLVNASGISSLPDVYVNLCTMKDKELTKRKLIDTIGEISKVHGFKSVRISKVSRQAGADRKLVYRYFGDLNNLIEAYIIENDYWMLFADH